MKTFPLEVGIKNEIFKTITSVVKSGRQLNGYQPIDAVFRLAGTGSVGLERYIILLQHTETRKIRLVDMKEANSSCLLRYLPASHIAWKNEAQRITTLQHFVQHVAPSLLQPVKMGAKHYVLKALQPSQDRMDLQLCKKTPGQLEYMIATMARLAASGHLRSGGRMGSSITDQLIEFAKNASQWKVAINTYAKNYAKKVAKDHAEFSAAFPVK